MTEALAKAYDAYSFKVIPQVGEWVARTADRLSVPGREHPPLPRPADLRRHDRDRRLQASDLHQLHRRRRGPAPGLGALTL
ncbi:hypothetical protein ACRAWD_17280 [Caulobacter segnis]